MLSAYVLCEHVVAIVEPGGVRRLHGKLRLAVQQLLYIGQTDCEELVWEQNHIPQQVHTGDLVER